MGRIAQWIRWLDHEITQVPVGTRQLVVKRLHGAFAVAAIVIAVIVGAAAGFFAGYSYPYKTVPPPPVPPGQTVPDCNAQSPAQHHAGSCLPQPPKTTPTPAPGATSTQNVAYRRVLLISQTTKGSDRSNNDPVCSDAYWASIASQVSFSIFKVNEGDFFPDGYAQCMAYFAKRHGLTVGAYDFLRVCGPDPRSEANYFIDHAIQDGLDPRGPHMLPPTGDAEFGAHGVDDVNCNARAWLLAWLDQVRNRVGRTPMIYTGAWWWCPHIGSFWPAGSLAWISGYTGNLSTVPRACGNGRIDIWQLTSSGTDGAPPFGSVDLNVWLNGVNAFRAWTNSGPTPAQYLSWRKARDSSLRGYTRQGCTQPVLTREACRTLALRVNSFQVLVDQEGKGPRCFGARASPRAPVCQIVRPAMAIWSRASASSHRYHNEQASRWFDGRIAHTLTTSRL